MWVTFENRDTAPFPRFTSAVSTEVTWEICAGGEGASQGRFRVGDGEWQPYPMLEGNIELHGRFPLSTQLSRLHRTFPHRNSFDPSESDIDYTPMMELGAVIFAVRNFLRRPFANAAIRSRPQRRYDPMLQTPDAQGEYIPSYLAGLARSDPDEWQSLKRRLERFGDQSGLFDEISVRSLGKSDGDPFQLQIRKFGKRRKGRPRNLIDVGYGISQVLPTLTEVFRANGPSTSFSCSNRKCTCTPALRRR